MSALPLSAQAHELLLRPNPAVIATVRPDGQPVSVATWYLWSDGKVLVNMDEGRKRLEFIRHDARVSLTVLSADDWDSHVSLQGRVVRLADDQEAHGHRSPCGALHRPPLPSARSRSCERVDRYRLVARMEPAVERQGSVLASLSLSPVETTSASKASRTSSHGGIRSPADGSRPWSARPSPAGTAPKSVSGQKSGGHVGERLST